MKYAGDLSIQKFIERRALREAEYDDACWNAHVWGTRVLEAKERLMQTLAELDERIKNEVAACRARQLVAAAREREAESDARDRGHVAEQERKLQERTIQ